MAVTRYDLRRQLVVDEANAIGTTNLRVDLLPEPARTRLRPVLREYVESRLAFSHAGLEARALEDARKRSKRLQVELWESTVAAAEESPTPITARFVETVNHTIDLDESRLEALENRIPVGLWAMLWLLSLLAAYMTGATVEERSALSMLLPPLMIAVVMALIADLDTPGAGVIQEHPHSIERLLFET
jgi:hypothetical protein